MKLTTNNQHVLMEIFKQEMAENNDYVDEADFFEFFAAKQVMKHYDLSDSEVESGIVGKGADGGCDAIYVLLNGILIKEDNVSTIQIGREPAIDIVIVQAKRENSFNESVVTKWKTIVANLLPINADNSKFIKRYNEDVLEAFSIFRELYKRSLRQCPKLKFLCFYCSFADNLHPNVEQQADELKEIFKNQYPSDLTLINVDFWGADKMISAIQKMECQQFSLLFTENPISLKNDYVGLVNLKDYYQFITAGTHTIQTRIFEANVRDYQGHNAVNQDIQRTLEHPDTVDFWWLNNGITIVAESARLLTTRNISLMSPSIVNGLQTSNEIFNYFNSSTTRSDDEKRNVLVRIIIPESEESRDRIILATNNQTDIPKASLRANDPIHWKIEQFLKGKGLFYDRRKNYYKNQGKNCSEIISLSFLSQCLMSLLLQMPNYARARPSTLLTDDTNYSILYSEKYDLNIFYKAALLGKKISSIIKRKTDYSVSQKTDILFYVLYYSVAKILKKIQITADDVANLELNLFTEEYVLSVTQCVYNEYNSLGGTGKLAKSSMLIDKLKSIL